MDDLITGFLETTVFQTAAQTVCALIHNCYITGYVYCKKWTVVS